MTVEKSLLEHRFYMMVDPRYSRASSSGYHGRVPVITNRYSRFQNRYSKRQNETKDNLENYEISTHAVTAPQQLVSKSKKAIENTTNEIISPGETAGSDQALSAKPTIDKDVLVHQKQIQKKTWGPVFSCMFPEDTALWDGKKSSPSRLAAMQALQSEEDVLDTLFQNIERVACRDEVASTSNYLRDSRDTRDPDITALRLSSKGKNMTVTLENAGEAVEYPVYRNDQESVRGRQHRYERNMVKPQRKDLLDNVFESVEHFICRDDEYSIFQQRQRAIFDAKYSHTANGETEKGNHRALAQREGDMMDCKSNTSSQDTDKYTCEGEIRSDRKEDASSAGLRQAPISHAGGSSLPIESSRSKTCGFKKINGIVHDPPGIRIENSARHQSTIPNKRSQPTTATHHATATGKKETLDSLAAHVTSIVSLYRQERASRLKAREKLESGFERANISVDASSQKEVIDSAWPRSTTPKERAQAKASYNVIEPQQKDVLEHFVENIKSTVSRREQERASRSERLMRARERREKILERMRFSVDANSQKCAIDSARPQSTSPKERTQAKPKCNAIETQQKDILKHFVENIKSTVSRHEQERARRLERLMRTRVKLERSFAKAELSRRLPARE